MCVKANLEVILKDTAELGVDITTPGYRDFMAGIVDAIDELEKSNDELIARLQVYEDKEQAAISEAAKKEYEALKASEICFLDYLIPGENVIKERARDMKDLITHKFHTEGLSGVWAFCEKYSDDIAAGKEVFWNEVVRVGQPAVW